MADGLSNAEKLARARATIAKLKENQKSKPNKKKSSSVEIAGEKYSSKELKEIAEREIKSRERDHKINLRENNELKTFEEMLKYAVVAGAGYGWLKARTGLFSLIPKFTDHPVNDDAAVAVVLYAIATRASMGLDWRKRIMALCLSAVSSAANTLGATFEGLDSVADKIAERVGVTPQRPQAVNG